VCSARANPHPNTSPRPRCAESAPAAPPYARTLRTAGPSAVSPPYARRPSPVARSGASCAVILSHPELERLFKPPPRAPPRATACSSPPLPPPHGARALRSCSPPTSYSGSALRPQYTSPARLLPNTLPPSRVSPSRRDHRRRPPSKPVAGRFSTPTPATYSP
jgi:hypothetical protein